MDVTLTPSDEKLVRDRPRTGRYPSPQAVVSAALQALSNQDLVRAELDDAWRKAEDPRTEWLDGEQVFYELLSGLPASQASRGGRKAAQRPSDVRGRSA